jgi:glycosyltransferase involved in cell wall biosynthesis
MRCPSLFELPPASAGYTGWPWTAEGARVPDRMEDGTPWPLISIVTPSYNQGEFLEATIRSILLQGYPDLEYIVMDGGSTDGSLAIIRKYEPWLTHWESGGDGGQYAAVQKGFNCSHGEIMAWLNSDDMYFPWTLKTTGNIFAHFSRIEWLTTSNMAATSSDANAISFWNETNYSRRWFLENRNLHKSNGVIQQESTFWRRSLWEKAGSRLDYRLRYAGDLELWMRFFEYTTPVTTNTPLGIFRYHEEQKASVMDNYIQEAEDIFKRMPRPIWLPRLLLRILLYPLKRLNPDVNWFETRCDKTRFDPKLSQWVYIKSFLS